MNILIAEDDKFLASAYKVKLSKEGHEADIAENGEIALKFLQQNSYDILVLDLIMPVKDGFAVLKEIKDMPSLHNLPILIASNLGQKEDIDKGLALGAKDFVIKSDMSLDNLVQRIVELVKKYPSSTSQSVKSTTTPNTKSSQGQPQEIIESI